MQAYSVYKGHKKSQIPVIRGKHTNALICQKMPDNCLIQTKTSANFSYRMKNIFGCAVEAFVVMQH